MIVGTWRSLREDEGPCKGVGRGPSDAGLAELVCPDFDTYAEYEMVMIEGDDAGQQFAFRAAKQGEHVTVGFDRTVGSYRCACGRTFSANEAQRRIVQ